MNFANVRETLMIVGMYNIILWTSQSSTGHGSNKYKENTLLSIKLVEMPIFLKLEFTITRKYGIEIVKN